MAFQKHFRISKRNQSNLAMIKVRTDAFSENQAVRFAIDFTAKRISEKKIRRNFERGF